MCPRVPRIAVVTVRSFGREYALVYRAGLLNKTGSFEVTLRDKLNNFAHLLSEAEIGRKYSAKLLACTSACLQGQDGPSVTWCEMHKHSEIDSAQLLDQRDRPRLSN